LNRKARLAQVNRRIDWELMALFGHEGPHSVESPVLNEPVAFSGGGVGGGLQPSGEKHFFVWAVQAGPMVWKHVFRACRSAKYPLSLSEKYRDVFPGAERDSETYQKPLLYYAVSRAPWGEPVFATRADSMKHESVRMASDLEARIEVIDHLVKNGAPLEFLGTRLGFPFLSSLSSRVWDCLEKHGLTLDKMPAFQRMAGFAIWAGGRSSYRTDVHEGVMMDRLHWFLSRGLSLNALSHGTWGENVFLSVLRVGIWGAFPGRVLHLLAILGADIHATNVGSPGEGGIPAGGNAWHAALSDQSILYSEVTSGDGKRFPCLLRKMRLLHDLRVNPNVQDEHGNTPFHLLAGEEKSTPGLVLALVRWGGEPSLIMKNNAGQTPLDWAATWGNPEVRDLLQAMESRRQAMVLHAVLPGLQAPLTPDLSGKGARRL
jgi:hypothetical protein